MLQSFLKKKGNSFAAPRVKIYLAICEGSGYTLSHAVILLSTQ